MVKIRSITGTNMVKFLKKLGFVVIRQKGSHVFLRHRDGRTTVIPCHKGQDLDKGLLYKILKDIELTPGEFNTIQ